MNILFYTSKNPYFSSSYGGAESSMQLIAKHLVGKGHKVTWLSQEQSGYGFPRYRSQNKEGIAIISFKPIKGARIISLINCINKWLFWRLLCRLIRQKKINLVYCFYELHIIKLLNVLKMRGHGVKIVVRMAGLHWYEKCRQNPGLISSYEKEFNNLDSVNFIHGGLEKMVKTKFNELQMNVVFKHSFVGDIGSSRKIGRPVKHKYLCSPDFRLIMVSRFSHYQKRQDILIEAVSLLKDKMPFKLTLVGDGPRVQQMQQNIYRLGLQKHVNILPFMDQNGLWDLLMSMDLLCHACDYEGLSKIIIEAMAGGLPVLASDVLPLNEYIEDGENGFLVKNQADLWANKLLDLFFDSSSRATVSDNEISFVKKHYDPAKNITLYEKEFSRVFVGF